MQYWKQIVAIVAAVAVAGLTWYVKDLRDAKAQATALDAQKTLLTASCDADKALTDDHARTYDQTIIDLNKRIADLQLRPARCVPVASKRPVAVNDSAGSLADGQGNGLETYYLYDFSGRCEKYRLQVIGLQSFIKDVWARTPARSSGAASPTGTLLGISLPASR